MKKYFIIAFVYAILAMAGGVFFREFTKFNEFTGTTSLGKVHTHLFMLGMIVFLLVALFEGKFHFKNGKLTLSFLIIYNCGVGIAAAAMLARGCFQVMGTALSAGADGALSGVAGIGHMLTAVGLILFFCMLFSALKSGNRNAK